MIGEIILLAQANRVLSSLTGIEDKVLQIQRQLYKKQLTRIMDSATYRQQRMAKEEISVWGEACQLPTTDTS